MEKSESMVKTYRYEVKVVGETASANILLNTYCNDGWELYKFGYAIYGEDDQFAMVFRKEK